ncbi:MAG: hypothetical protein WD379_06820 [Dehalococcoidia bacterium]
MATATGSPEPAIQLSPQPPESDPSQNVFTHPGFEDCPDSDVTPCGEWFALKPPDFEVTSDQAHSGDRSVHLKMRQAADAEGVAINYLVQEVNPTEFPEVISGAYRVDNWKRGTEKQYLQFVVIVWGAANAPTDPNGERFGNHQIRYLLTGIDSDPFQIANAKFVYIHGKEPVQGEWVPFEVNVKQDFLDLWGEVPTGYERVRLLFEVRYDDKVPGDPAEADVYYDDLYFGPAEGSPAG